MPLLGPLAFLGVGLLTACSTAETPLCDGILHSGTGPSGYSLGSGDQLQIVVFLQPDLSGGFSLDRLGYLALPLLGEIAAGGLTTRQLEDEIESRRKAGDFLVSPQVGVQLVTHRSFYVLGVVGTPGSYEYRSGLTVITAVALAGGYHDFRAVLLSPWQTRRPSDLDHWPDMQHDG